VSRQRTVPGNRWDLVAAEVDATRPGPVAVVVPYFEQPESLRRLYAAIAVSDLPTDSELVVVDDGSSAPPPAAPTNLPLRVRHLRQDDLGCRPGAARNRGVAATRAPLLVFLDADTLPSPDTISRLARWPHTLPDALVVGRRHHVDLDGWSPADVGAWLRGDRRPPPRRPDPAWLQRGYDETHDLLHADRRSYRFVISAVMACHRSLYEDIGGFDASRHEYGGDDWELAARAWVHGAVLVHDRRAVAWHDEPDWADRTDAARIDKDHETMWLAAHIPEPLTRGRGLRHQHPDTLVALDWDDELTPGQYVATIDSTLQAVPDSVVRLSADVPARVVAHVAHDPRVITASSPRDSSRNSITMVLVRPVAWEPAQLARVLHELRDETATIVEIMDGSRRVATITPSRTSGRVRRAATRGASASVIAELTTTRRIDVATIGAAVLHDDTDLAAELGGWARRSSTPRRPDDQASSG
jgi:GT2 family glycosyltransferase